MGGLYVTRHFSHSTMYFEFLACTAELHHSGILAFLSSPLLSSYNASTNQVFFDSFSFMGMELALNHHHPQLKQFLCPPNLSNWRRERSERKGKSSFCLWWWSDVRAHAPPSSHRGPLAFLQGSSSDPATQPLLLPTVHGGRVFGSLSSSSSKFFSSWGCQVDSWSQTQRTTSHLWEFQNVLRRDVSLGTGG